MNCRQRSRCHAIRTPPGGEAPMAGQQFVAKFSSDSFRSIAVAVRECANSLITKEPLGDRKVAVTKILRGEIGAELIEDVTKAQGLPQPASTPMSGCSRHAAKQRGAVSKWRFSDACESDCRAIGCASQ